MMNQITINSKCRDIINRQLYDLFLVCYEEFFRKYAIKSNWNFKPEEERKQFLSLIKKQFIEQLNVDVKDIEVIDFDPHYDNNVLKNEFIVFLN